MTLPNFAPKVRRAPIHRSHQRRRWKCSQNRILATSFFLVLIYVWKAFHFVVQQNATARIPAATWSPKRKPTREDGRGSSPSLLQSLRNIQAWDRLVPSHGGNVYGESDDSFLTGKSCRWKPTRFYYLKKILSWIFFFSRASFLGTWECRDCGRDQYLDWENCPLLTPRGKCPAFEFQGWENPRPRSASTYDPLSKSPFPMRLITSYGVGKVRKVEYVQPQCFLLKKPCFDMDRCSNHHPVLGPNGNAPNSMHSLSVFGYPGRAAADLTNIIANRYLSLSDFKLVDDPRSACLLIVHADDIDAAKNSESWNFGANHFIYGVTVPINETSPHYDMAALGSVVLTEAQIRPGYDIPLPLPAIWRVEELAENSLGHNTVMKDPHRPRKYLLTFKGSIQDTLQPYYQHRWLAAEYLYEDADVVIDVQCKHKTLWGKTVRFAPYDNTSQEHFDDLMTNSTFAFCPGGSHVTSFRFTEVLSAGSIPVLLPEIVTPFYPEVDWSGCVLRVSQSRIVDLPRILRGIPPDDIRERQTRCQQLYRAFMKTKTPKVTNDDGFLAPALRIWRTRLEKQGTADRLDGLLLQSTKNPNVVA